MQQRTGKRAKVTPGAKKCPERDKKEPFVVSVSNPLGEISRDQKKIHRNAILLLNAVARNRTEQRQNVILRATALIGEGKFQEAKNELVNHNISNYNMDIEAAKEHAYQTVLEITTEYVHALINNWRCTKK